MRWNPGVFVCLKCCRLSQESATLSGDRTPPLPDPLWSPRRHTSCEISPSDKSFITFRCGSTASFKMQRASPAESNMFSIITLQRFDNHHGCCAPHLKSAHSWLAASARRSHISCANNACLAYTVRSKVKTSHQTNNTFTDLRQSLAVLFCCEQKRSLICHLASEVSSSVPHEATSGL